jgi:ketosteroid isomerase-like protein
MPASVPEVITRYFDADARRDTDTIVSLFTEDAVVIDESETWRGSNEIRAWREGPAARYEYTTEVHGTDRAGDDEYIATGRLEGNFPGGTAALRWRFTLAGDLIRRLHIAP